MTRRSIEQQSGELGRVLVMAFEGDQTGKRRLHVCFEVRVILRKIRCQDTTSEG
jgi:hypothetical protein